MIEAFESSVVRAAEAPLLVRGEPLMARAAFALVGAVVRELRENPRIAPVPGRGRTARPVLSGTRAVLLVGPGNNGGDTLVAGALLARRGVRVCAVLAADRVHDAGLAALRAAGGTVASLAPADAAALVRTADVVLDGLLGIGGSGGLRGGARDVARATGDGHGARVLTELADHRGGEGEGRTIHQRLTSRQERSLGCTDGGRLEGLDHLAIMPCTPR